MSGNAKSAMIRCRSRSSLMKSRCASARIAEASLTRLPHDLEVRIFKAGRVGLHDRQRGLDGAKDRVDGVPVELELEGRTAARAAHLAEMLPERAAARHVEARRRLVQKEDLGIVQEAAHDLELPAHAARECPHRLVDIASDAEELREVFDLRAVFAMHERVC